MVCFQIYDGKDSLVDNQSKPLKRVVTLKRSKFRESYQLKNEIHKTIPLRVSDHDKNV